MKVKSYLEYISESNENSIDRHESSWCHVKSPADNSKFGMSYNKLVYNFMKEMSDDTMSKIMKEIGDDCGEDSQSVSNIETPKGVPYNYLELYLSPRKGKYFSEKFESELKITECNNEWFICQITNKNKDLGQIKNNLFICDQIGGLFDFLNEVVKRRSI